MLYFIANMAPGGADEFAALSLHVTKNTVPKTADPRLVWIASVLAAAVLVVYVTHI
jgi:hypothetical protein